jgi:hypothetical protein
MRRATAYRSFDTPKLERVVQTRSISRIRSQYYAFGPELALAALRTLQIDACINWAGGTEREPRAEGAWRTVTLFN